MNNPGLPRIRRRVVTQGTAKATMLRALSQIDLPATAPFTARTDEDFAIAFADAAATVADIVTFYTERLVNEHYIRTAGERRSLVELSRLIGYRVRPGLAPTADLAFSLDQSPGAPAHSVIAAGTGVQSSPDPGQTPVVYETLADIDASPAWNAIRPRARVPHPNQPGASLSLAGSVSISAGDGVLFRTGNISVPVTFGLVSSVSAVDMVPDLPGRPGSPAHTDITLRMLPTLVGSPPTDLLPAPPTAGPVPSSVSWLAGSVMSAADLDASLLSRSASLDDVAGPFAASVSTPAEVLVFRQQRALFGSQAPLASSLAAAVVNQTGSSSGVPAAVTAWAQGLSLPWESATVATLPVGASGDVFLDGATPAVAADSMLVLRDGSTWGAYKITTSASVGVAVFAISGRAVRVHVASSGGLTLFSIRGTTAFCAPVSVPLADVAAAESIGVSKIELNGLQLGLRENRPVVVTGEPVEDRGHPISLATTLSAVVHDFGPARSTTVTLADSLPSGLARPTTTIAANVAPASQGETRNEIMGSGDSRLAFQSFALRQPPLTHLSADSPSGLAGTLTIWVDSVRWSPVDSFEGCGPDDHVYLVRSQDGQTIVQFGDGVTGSRLPTGTANLRARYRSGGDLSGVVRSGRLTLPMSRAGGVTGVSNPGPSEGGDDPEDVDSARTSAPLRVTTIDRIVSMPDYALYARAFPGVAKAQAVWARAGTHRGVLLTVAGDRGAILRPDRGIGLNLLGAMRTYGDPLVPVTFVPFVPKSFRITATVKTDPARVRADVLAAVSARLQAVFSFDARDLGQDVPSSEVLTEIEGVMGVVAATITGLWKFDPRASSSGPGTVGAGPPPVLVADAPAPGVDIGSLVGAELIVIDSAPIAWGVLQ